MAQSANVPVIILQRRSVSTTKLHTTLPLPQAGIALHAEDLRNELSRIVNYTLAVAVLIF
jgi:hypothetical protein